MSAIRPTIAGGALCAALLSVCAAGMARPTPGLPAPSAAPPAPSAASPASYLLREQEGELCVFSGQTLLHRTGIPVAALPAADRERLRQGIPAQDRQALYALLEDLAS